MAQQQKTPDEVREILSDISFLNHKFVLLTEGEPGSERMFLQIHYLDRCVESGELQEQHTRKWLISSWATKGEIVRTAFKALLTSQEHIAREFFTYRGKSIFGPHFDVDALWEICKGENIERRDPK